MIDFVGVIALLYIGFTGGFWVCQWLEERYMDRLVELIVDKIQERIMESFLFAVNRKEKPE